ncbi:MAG: type II secretion system protein GspE [Deltaproteobacteria bacterium]|nr:type II secretion system protein GspE [Deltaproteobacteria bacterium]
MTRFESLLLATGKISIEDLRRVQRVQQERSESLERLLVELGFLSEDDLLNFLAEYYQAPILTARDFPQTPPSFATINPGFFRQSRICPVAVQEDQLTVAMVDPGDFYVVESLQKATGMRLRRCLAKERDILEALNTYYADGASDPAERNGENETAEVEYLQDDQEDVEHLRDLASEAPVIRLVNTLIARALERRASDIHIEPFEKELQVRYRIDGILHDVEAPPRKLQAALISRVKLMAKLNIAERRLPQDGRIKLRMLGREIDLRVSTLPTLYGESVVMRILDRSSIVVSLETLGFPTDTMSEVEKQISRPYGMILVTGPTGSGKTTTLYGSLDKINSPDKKIITIEDPVEYQLAGVNQIHVKPQIGLTFANGLRSIVRQDPDVIMIGEIRDFETAEIAVQAALTGHLVFSTLHTNDAAGAISRLLEMGVEDYLLASSLLAVMAQRLVRTLCPHCRRPVEGGVLLSDNGNIADGTNGAHGTPMAAYEARGCEACDMTGYHGRSGIFELLIINEGVRQLILKHSSSDIIKNFAVTQGMRTLREDGWRKVREGTTTVAEVLRVTQDE